MKNIVVFTGAGVSAESGLGTFRDSDGLWEKYRIEDVCTHEAWLRNPQLCVDFYNARRRDTLAAQPNAAHYAITRLQEAIPTTRIITQGSDKLVPGTSVFTSSETDISGNFWGHIKGVKYRFALQDGTWDFS